MDYRILIVLIHYFLKAMNNRQWINVSDCAFTILQNESVRLLVIKTSLNMDNVQIPRTD